VGRREEALDAAREAVGIYRGLAERRPDAFEPDLATSLAVLHLCHKAMAQHSKAWAAIGEAMGLLSPVFQKLPEAFAPLMARIVQCYVEASREAGEAPDMEALAPILATLERLKRQEEQDAREP